MCVQVVAVAQAIEPTLALDAACYQAMQDLAGLQPSYSTDDLAASAERRLAQSPLAPCQRLPVASRAARVSDGEARSAQLQRLWGS